MQNWGGSGPQWLRPGVERSEGDRARGDGGKALGGGVRTRPLSQLVVSVVEPRDGEV